MVHACDSPRPWQRSETKFLQRISNQLAIAIYQSDLYSQLQTELKERRQTETALRQSEARLTAAQAIACMGHWELIAATGAMAWSDQLFDIAGLSPHQGAPGYGDFLTMCHPEDRDPLNQQVIAALEQGTPYQIIFRFIRPDQAIRYIESRAETEQNAAGQVIRIFGTAQDISDRYEIDRLKDEFIGIVSHELRTPMTAIQSALVMLTAGAFDDDPDQAAQMLRIAQTNTERLVRLVSAILDLERLESGQDDFAIEPYPIADLVQSSIETLQPLADQAQVGLIWEPCAAHIYVDPDAIIQTLTNLLSNAIKFSAPGSRVVVRGEETGDRRQETGDRGQEVEDLVTSTLSVVADDPCRGRYPQPPITHPRAIAAQPRTPLKNSKFKIQNSKFLASPHLLLSITDQGRGIPADKLESIFNRFQQVESVDSRQKGGTGLGLAICKTIVEKHGGQIWAESVVGEGSTFYVTLPLAGEEER
jgi:signal transduction histidine kinase